MQCWWGEWRSQCSADQCQECASKIRVVDMGPAVQCMLVLSGCPTSTRWSVRLARDERDPELKCLETGEVEIGSQETDPLRLGLPPKPCILEIARSNENSNSGLPLPEYLRDVFQWREARG